MIETESSNLEPIATAAQLRAWSARIIAATSAMKVLMQELLDVARVQMGQALTLDLRQMDLVNLAQRLAGELEAAGQHVTILSSLAELDGWWDEARLSRVLSNLLDNGFNNGWSTKFTVDTDQFARPRDTGAEFLYAFEAFGQLKNFNQHEFQDAIVRGSTRSDPSGAEPE